MATSGPPRLIERAPPAILDVPAGHLVAVDAVDRHLEVALGAGVGLARPRRISFLLTSITPKLWPVGQPTG